MKKEEFLKKLEKRLSILNEEERKDILDEYRNHLDKKMKEGMSEEEAVKDFGDFDTLIKDILSAYKINENYSKPEKGKLENIFNIIIEEMVNFFQKLIQMLSNKKGEDLLRVICKLILALTLIWILRIPAWIIRELGESVFRVFPGFLEEVLSVSWSIIIESFYVIISILMLYNVIKKTVLEEETKEKTEEVQLEKNQEKNTVTEETQNLVRNNSKTTPDYSSYILNPLMIIVKIFVVLLTIPIVCIWLGLMVGLGIMIALLIKGLFLVSPLFIIIGLILMTTSVLGLIYRTVWKGDKA